MLSDKKIIIITRQRSTYGGMLLESAKKFGISISCVLVQSWGLKQNYHRFLSLVRRHGLFSIVISKLIEALDSLILNIIHIRKKKQLPIELLAINLGVPIIKVPTLNGEEMLNTISSLKPDLILLGGVGVVSTNLIQLATIGVLNGHPGLVPRYRGNHVVRWALFDGSQVGVTIHMVDAGIDTGDVVLIEPVDLPPMLSLRGLETFTDICRANLLANAARNMLNERVEQIPQKNKAEFPLYSYMPPMMLIRTYISIWKRTKKMRV